MTSLLGGMLGAVVAPCRAEIRVDAQGALPHGGPQHGCSTYDFMFFGLRPTSLRPGLRFPKREIGVGARWQVAGNEQPATYVLLDTEQGMSTVVGEFEPRPIPGAPPTTRPPKTAWMLARLRPGDILTASTLAWGPIPSDESAEAATIADTPTTLTRVNSVAASEANPRDGIRQALTRALNSTDLSVLGAAVGASGISNDWWLIDELFAVRAQHPAIELAVDRALGLLTGRRARGIEDFIEASAPHACDGDARRAEAILIAGIALGGTPAERAKLLAFHGEIRRLSGDVAGAHQDFMAALHLSPSEEDVARSFAWWLLTAPNATDRNPRQALQIARSLTKSIMMLSEQAEAAAHAELSDFAKAEEIERGVVARLQGAWRFTDSDASSDRRLAAARARLEAYAQKRRWPNGLVRDELEPCYRFFGLSHTLL